MNIIYSPPPSDPSDRCFLCFLRIFLPIPCVCSMSPTEKNKERVVSEEDELPDKKDKRGKK